MNDKDYLLLLTALAALVLTTGFFGASLLYSFLPGFLVIYFYRHKSLLEDFLYSVPLSFLLVYWPYFVLTRGFNLVLKNYFLITPLAISTLVSLLNLDKLKKIKFKKPRISVNPEFLLVIIGFITVFLIIYTPFLYLKQNPLTLGAKWVYETHELVQSIVKGGFVDWSTKWYSGMTTFYSYPPLSYLVPAAQSALTGVSAWKNLNLSLYAFTLLFGLSLYAFLKEFKIRREVALLLSLVAITLPITVKVSEVTKTIMDQFFINLFLLSFMRFLKEPRREALVLTVTLFAWFMTYYFNVYVLIFPTLAALALYFKQVKRKKQVLLWGVLSVVTALLLSGAWLAPFFSWLEYFPFHHQEGAWMSIMDTPAKFFEIVAKPLDFNKLVFNMPTLTSLTPQFFYAGLLSVIVLLTISKKKLSEQNLPGILSLILIGYVFLQFTPVWEFIPKYEILFGRVYQYYLLIPLFAFSMGRLLTDYTKKMGEKKKLLVTTLVIGLFAHTVIVSHNMSSLFLYEPIMTERNVKPAYELIYNTAEAYPNGRFVVFGIYGPAVIPGLTYWTGKPAFAGYGFESHATTRVYENTILPVQQASMDFIKRNNSILAYNVFRNAGVDLVFADVCTNYGLLSYKVFYPDYEKKEGECIKAFHFNDTSLAQKPVLTKVYSPAREATILGVLQRKSGYKFTFLANDSLPLSDYDAVLSDTVTDVGLDGFNGTLLFVGLREDFENIDYEKKEYLGSGVTSFENVTLEPQNIGVERSGNEFVFRNVESGEHVLLKQAYFPKWRAYQSGEQLPIIESYHGYMIVKSQSIGVITFEPAHTMVELVGGAISLVGFLGVLIIGIKSGS